MTYGVRKSSNYDDLRRINFKVICRWQSFSNGMFCSCRICTDKCVVWSLYNSRTSCWLTIQKLKHLTVNSGKSEQLTTTKPKLKQKKIKCHNSQGHNHISALHYRVAENKIPHQTVCNISAIQCIHCTLIIQPHYHVKQLLWKLQFLTGEFFCNTGKFGVIGTDFNTSTICSL